MSLTQEFGETFWLFIANLFLYKLVVVKYLCNSDRHLFVIFQLNSSIEYILTFSRTNDNVRIVVLLRINLVHDPHKTGSGCESLLLSGVYKFAQLFSKLLVNRLIEVIFALIKSAELVVETFRLRAQLHAERLLG